MRPKGKTAWLITWEGPESEHNGRCKVIAVLPSRYGDESVVLLLRVLFYSEYLYTLGEKMVPSTSIGKDSRFKEAYRDINPEFCYGHFPKQYLRARRVKNLYCEESETDCLESTLHWTELPKFIPNPKYGPEGPGLEDIDDGLKEAVGEKEVQYTYSIRTGIEEEKRRQLKTPSG